MEWYDHNQKDYIAIARHSAVTMQAAKGQNPKHLHTGDVLSDSRKPKTSLRRSDGTVTYRNMQSSRMPPLDTETNGRPWANKPLLGFSTWSTQLLHDIPGYGGTNVKPWYGEIVSGSAYDLNWKQGLTNAISVRYLMS